LRNQFDEKNARFKSQENVYQQIRRYKLSVRACQEHYFYYVMDMIDIMIYNDVQCHLTDQSDCRGERKFVKELNLDIWMKSKSIDMYEWYCTGVYCAVTKVKYFIFCS